MLEGPELEKYEYVYDPKKRKIDLSKKAYKYENVDADESPIEIVRTYKHREADDYYMFPRGDLAKLKKVFKHIKWEDCRTKAPIEHKLIFTGSMYKDQERVVGEWLDSGTGILKADTGWGKNFVLSYLIAYLKQRAIVFCDTKGLVDQLHEEFRENTNIAKLEKKLGKKLAGTVHESKIKSFYDVATFTTYQTFLDRWSENLKLLRQHRDHFGFVWLNECHIAPAKEISKTFQFLNSYWRGGDTATPERKDGKEVITYDLVGPVTAEGETDSEPCSCKIVHTGINLHPMMRSWSNILGKLTDNDKRNSIIIDNVIAGVNAGNTVLILTDRRSHAERLRRRLKLEGYDFGLHYGSAAKHNNEVRKAAKRGELNGIVAVSKTTEKGFNVPLLDELHITCPMNNAPNLKQRIGRVRRVWLICKKCSTGHSKRVSVCKKCGSDNLYSRSRLAVYYADAGNDMIFKCAMGTKSAMTKLGFEVSDDYTHAPVGNVGEGRSSMGFSKFKR